MSTPIPFSAHYAKTLWASPLYIQYARTMAALRGRYNENQFKSFPTNLQKETAPR